MAAKPRFILLEPSKVGPQHITLIEGYLRALHATGLQQRGVELWYRAAESSFAALAPEVQTFVRHQPIKVINPERRQWVRKIAQEFGSVRSAVRSLRPRDQLLITCLSSPTLLLVEATQGMLRRRQVTVVLHSELEALFDPNQRSWKSWGLWAFLWSRIRDVSSRLQLAVIASFIQTALTHHDAERFAGTRILPFPVLPFPAQEHAANGAAHVAMFIGYRTRFKGFDRFARWADGRFPHLEFRTVGAGQVERLLDGDTRPIDPAIGFLGEVAKASVAVFPYSDGYAASLSAAMLDALSTGVHVLATRRACFTALHDELGPDFITLFDTDAEAEAILADTAFLDRIRSGAAARRARLADSSFGQKATEAAFAAMLDEAGYPARDPLAKKAA